MGTRNLTMVINTEGETKIAQYGQWDGYPAGQGATVLEFLKSADIDHFTHQLSKVRFTTPEDEKIADMWLDDIGSTDGWLTNEQAELYYKQYPYWSRDICANILHLVNDSRDDEIVLRDGTTFLEDGLFCEWAYAIDLQNKTLKVYKNGANILKEYDIDDLPNKDVFINELEHLANDND